MEFSIELLLFAAIIVFIILAFIDDLTSNSSNVSQTKVAIVENSSEPSTTTTTIQRANTASHDSGLASQSISLFLSATGIRQGIDSVSSSLHFSDIVSIVTGQHVPQQYNVNVVQSLGLDANS